MATKTCTNAGCGKRFTPVNGSQKRCNECRLAEKAQTAGAARPEVAHVSAEEVAALRAEIARMKAEMNVQGQDINAIIETLKANYVRPRKYPIKPDFGTGVLDTSWATRHTAPHPKDMPYVEPAPTPEQTGMRGWDPLGNMYEKKGVVP